MAHNDLAYSRVVEHQATGTPINLVLPVFTRPDVVQQAVAGILSGQISLSLMNVEALLVLANAVGFVALEAACVKYLCGQAQHMKARALVHLAQLADHLGLSSLLDAAAESLVVLPWHHNMEWLVALLKIPVYQKNTEQRNKLLHHPQRGACTELQVLAVLEHVGIPRADFASAVDLQGLQPAELRALLVILVDCEEDGPFLRAAVKQDLVPEALRAAPDRTQNVRILHNVMIPDAQSTLTLPDSMLTLDVRVCKDKEGQDLVGIYLQASADNLLCNHVHHFTIFALHPSKPYVRLCRGSRSKPVRRSWGWSNYLTRLQKEYPTGYSGPFTIGVSWQAVDNNVA